MKTEQKSYIRINGIKFQEKSRKNGLNMIQKSENYIEKCKPKIKIIHQFVKLK
jgi:hypothetical protein